MGKIKYTDVLTEYRVENSFGGSGVFSVAGNGKSASYLDFRGGELDLRGRGLANDSIGMSLAKGHINHAAASFEGEMMVTIDGSLSVKAFNRALIAGNFEGVLAKFLAKNDTITGSAGSDEHLFGYGGNDKINGGAGDDTINGGRGTDVLTGGDGSDVFEFGLGSGKDRIAHFDAEGGAGSQDLIHILSGTYSIEENAGGDAVIRLSAKDTLTLVGVSVDQIDNSDFLVII